MKPGSILNMLAVLSVTILTPGIAYSQSNIDSLWSLLQRAKPIQKNSPVWELAGKQWIKETCIYGDCTNGYGISISHVSAVAGRYQYEGRFLNATHHGIGIVKTANGSTRVGYYDHGKELGAYILKNNGLMQLRYASGSAVQKDKEEFGFALADIQKHQASSFEKFTPCKCLVRATHIEVEEYQQPYELTDQFKNFRGTGYRTETRRVEYAGLRNSCGNIIYIKAIANHRGYYFDNSLAVLPGYTIRKRPFNVTYTDIKEDIQYLGQYEAAAVSN